MELLRRLRGVIGNGLVWATAWVLGRLVLTGVAVLMPGASAPVWRLFPLMVMANATVGFINGVMFSVVFSLLNRRRTLSEIQSGRTAWLGLGVGVALPGALLAVAAALNVVAPIGSLLMSMVFGGCLGTTTAVGSVRLARSAVRRELLEG